MWWDKLGKPTCPHANYCVLHDTKDCKPDCAMYHVYFRQLSLSKIPNLFQEVGFLEDFNESDVDYNRKKVLMQYSDNIEERVSSGHGFFLYSNNVGNGKTSWACKMGMDYIKAMTYRVNQPNHQLVIFINIPDFIEARKMEMGTEEDQTDILIHNAKECDLLIIDELGAGKNSEWSVGVIYDIINYRYSRKKSVIITSNFPLDAIQGEMGSHIADRINALGPKIGFEGNSQRRAERWWEND